MSNENESGLAKRPEGGVAPVRQFLSVDDVVARANLVQEVKKALMKQGVHFGIVPGCKKPSLWKAGAEKLLMAFQIGVDFQTEEISTDDSIGYRVKARGFHQITGNVMGYAEGSCSSDEEKYKWRRAVNDKEFDEAPANRRRVKQGYDGEIRQVRTAFEDLDNTVLKMAQKRALVALALIVTGSSDFFEQDVEDMEPELLEARLNRTEERAPIRKPEAKKPEKDQGPKIPVDQGTALTDQIRAKKMTKAQVEEALARYGAKDLSDLPLKFLPEFTAWVTAQVAQA